MDNRDNTLLKYFFAVLLLIISAIQVGQSQSCGPQPPPPPCYGCPPDNPPPPPPPPPCCTAPCICIPVPNSYDPNEISGPTGYDTLRWVAKKDRMGFKVLFENDPVFATAPAQIVRITVPIHPSFNMNSLRLGSFGFGPYTFEVPPNRTYYAERLNPLEMLREQERILAELRAAEIERQRLLNEQLNRVTDIAVAGSARDAIPIKDSLGLLVDVIAGINVKKREIFWIFESIDPLTGRAPEEAFRGFLPVNDTLNGSGEGFVNFSIIPNQQVLTGDTSSAKASIVFDINEAIETNIWSNTIDALPPTSVMNPLPLRVAFPDSLELKWTGQDDTGGTGVKNYALYVAKDNGSYYLAADNITGNNYKFRGTPGSVYDFFVQARDQVGNLEPPKNSEGKVSFDLPSRLSARIVSRSDTVCAGNQATIALEGTPGATLRYVSSSSADTISLILTGNVQEIKLPGITNNTTFKLVRVQYLDKITALDTTIQVFARNQPSTNIIPSDSLFCADQLITLTLQHQTGEISSIVWKQIVTGASYTFTASSSQVIGVQYKDRFGCTYKKEKNISVNQVKVSVATLDNAGNSINSSICEGEKVRLVASGGSSYLWNTGATSPEILVSPSTSTQYQVVATKAGCKDSVEVKIGINPGLSVQEDIRNTCKDGKTGSISLSISGGTPGFKYLWATGERGNELKDLTAGIYQVEVRDTNGCSVTKSFEITENSTAPTLDVTVPPSLCGETPVVVNLKPSQSMRIEYSVDDGTGQLLDVLGNSQFNLNLGIFSKSLNLKIIKAVSLSTGCGIQGFISKDIDVISVPQIVSDNQTVCSDLPFTISTNISGNNQLQVFYNWEATYQGLKGTATRGTALVVGRDIISDKVSNQTNNTVQVLYKVSPYLLVGGQRCNGSPIEIGVRVQPIPDVVLPVNSITVCSGTPFKVELNGNLAGTSFKWSRNYSGNLISGLGNIEDALENLSNVAQEIKYTVFSNIGVCEGPEKTISVRLQPEPKMVVSTPEKICDGFADLTNPKLFIGSEPGLIYSFWRDPNLQQPIANPQKVTPGLYFISAKSSGGCSGLVNVKVQSSFKFQVNAPEPLCQGKLADLTKIEVTKGSDTSLVYSYWQDLSATKELQNPFAVPSGQYYIKATLFRGTENCFTILPITVNENKPKVKNLISDISICSGTEFKFNAELDIEGSIFEWTRSANTGLLNSPSKGIKQIGEVLTLVGNSPVKARYDYNLKTQGCFNQASESGFFEVNILPAPIISVSDSIEICNPTIDLTNLVASVRDITFTFSKDLQGNNRISNPTSFLPGLVFIRGENKSGCKTTKISNIYSRIAKGIVPGDLVICPPLKSNLQTFAINAGLAEKFTVNFYNDLQNNQILVNPNQVDTGTYYLSIKERSGSSPGCSAIIPVNVKSGLATLDSPLDLTEQCNGSLFNYKPQSRSGNVEFKWKFIGYEGDVEQDLISGNELVEVFLENKSSQIRNAKFQITAKGLTCTNSVSNYLIKVSVLPEVQLGLVDSLINVKSGDIFNIKAELTKQIPLARIDWIANYGGALGGKGKGLQSLPGSQVVREQLFNLSDSTIFATYFLTPLIKGNSYCYGETKLVKVKVLSTPISIPAGINGGIKTNFGIGVEGVELRLSGLNETHRNFSTNQGLFKFNEIPSGKDYTLLPILDINPLNGISTLDLIKLQHHIIGRKPILDPYQLIAADVNNSKSISLADLIELKKLILGLNIKFLNNKSWRFVDNEYKFPNPTNPWSPSFPELKNFNNLFGNQKGSFIGVKIGDLSGDAMANRGNLVSFRSNDPIKLYIDNPKLKKGDKFSVPVKMIGTDELDGIQFSLGFNSKVLKLLPSACVFPKSENVSYFEESALLTFASENNVYAGTELMNLVFEVLEDGYPENWIFLNNRVLISEGYKEDEKFPLELIFEHSKSLNLRPHAFQNFPNPFTKNTTVPFWLPETDLVWIKVFDLTGKLVLEEKDIFNRGYNSFEFKDGQFQNYNSLFYQIGGTNWMESRMMIRND